MIRDMREDDSVSVLSIYKEAIEEGESTFTVTLPPWPAFNNAHLPYLRFVYEEDGHVLGWIAVSRVYGAPAYDGYLEESIYVAKKARGRGVGKALIEHLIEESEKMGIWTLYGCIFKKNIASISLHEKAGFRIIGERRKSARDKFGVWLNTVLVERRSPLF